MAMLRTVVSAALAGAASLASAVDIGGTITISQPGVYGRIDIGRFPTPQLVLPQPIIVVQRPVPVAPQPVYLWVPPGHQKKWSKHCHRYRACGVPVYFVRDDWYRREVLPHRPRAAVVRPAPAYAPHVVPVAPTRMKAVPPGHARAHGKGHDKGHGKSKGKGHDKHR